MWAQVLAALQVLEVDGRKGGSHLLGQSRCFAFKPLTHRIYTYINMQKMHKYAYQLDYATVSVT